MVNLMPFVAIEHKARRANDALAVETVTLERSEVDRAVSFCHIIL